MHGWLLLELGDLEKLGAHYHVFHTINHLARERHKIPFGKADLESKFIARKEIAPARKQAATNTDLLKRGGVFLAHPSVEIRGHVQGKP